MVEFALVLPVLLLFIFGILDLGRSIFYYESVSQAVGEAARAAALAPSGLPSNSDVLAAAQRSAAWVSLPACPNGSATTSGLPAGQAWLFVNQPSSPNNNSDGANAPGGEAGSPSCAATPAVSGDKLQIEIVFNFTPFTPLISQVTGSQIFLSSTSIVPVEY
jgi:Flp pilus assembly protein TadG